MATTGKRLAVRVWLDGALCLLRFEHGKPGEMYYLCQLAHPGVQPLPEAVPVPLPAWSARVHGWRHGVRGLVPLCGFWSMMEHRNSIRFDACQDRKGREMVLVTASDRDMAGGVLRITRENYEEVMGRIRAWGEALAKGEI